MSAALESGPWGLGESGLSDGCAHLIDGRERVGSLDDDPEYHDRYTMLQSISGASEKTIGDLEISKSIEEKFRNGERLDQFAHKQPPANHLRKVAISFEHIEHKSSQSNEPTSGCALDSHRRYPEDRSFTVRLVFGLFCACTICVGIAALVMSFPKVVLGIIAYIALGICVGKILKGKFS